MSTMTSPASVDRELAAIVGDGNVKRTDLEINGVVPLAVVYPGLSRRSRRSPASGK